MIDASVLFDLISQHTALACLAITLITALECLALVGLFLPGTLLIFFFGTLAGSGLLPAEAVLGCTFLGAFFGDTCSYWPGRRYHQEIKGLQLLRKHQALFHRGQNFFHRHGGKGLIFGRFVGPLRPLVPLVAGMMNFSPLRFVLISLCSCVVWTIVYLFPGMFFGSSLVVVAQISGRLATIILLVTALFLSTAWLFRLTARGLETAGFLWMTNVGKWLNTRPASKKIAHTLRQFVRPTIRPYREPEGLGAFLLLFSLCMFGLFALAFHPGTDWHTALGNNSLAHFSPDSCIHDLMVLPSLHKGYPETLRMSKNMEDCRLILRLWSVARGDNEENPSLWVGMVGKQVRREYLGLFSLAVEVSGTHTFGLAQIDKDLGPGYSRQYKHRQCEQIQECDGQVLLVQENTSPPPMPLDVSPEQFPGQ